MRLIIVVGARPNFIKVGPLVPVLRKSGVDAALVHTGQHYDAAMSDVFFADLELPEPDWWLGVGSGTHAVQTAAAMVSLEDLFERERPDAVMVVGDVNSTLAGALAAAKIRLPVVHLEAGLRSGDMSMPEEVNRLVTDQLSAMLLAPTRDALDHLRGEGVDDSRVHWVGNIMAESVLLHLEDARSRAACAAFGLEPGAFALATIHRPENTDAEGALEGIVEGLARLGMPVILPAHPRVASRLGEMCTDPDGAVRVIEPVGYLDMLSLQVDARVVVTDSGGLQEESCMVGTPCVTVRRNTERVVTIDVGANRLCAAEPDAIGEAVREALASPTDWQRPERWDGDVSRRVVEALDGGVVPLAGY